MIIIAEVDSWLFMDQEKADAADIPTILVSKDQTGAKSFTTMRTLFQLKKWTSQRRFIPLLSCDEETYRTYEVFHVDAIPPFAILRQGRMLLINNKIDNDYNNALSESELTSEKEIFQFALTYIQNSFEEPVVLATNQKCRNWNHVPSTILQEDDVMVTGERLFLWANQAQLERGDKNE